MLPVRGDEQQRLLHAGVHRQLHCQCPGHVPEGGAGQTRWNPLSKVVRVRRGLPHRLIRLPAVLHGPPQLGLYHLLQHATLQRPKEEEARPVCGRAKPTPGKNTAPLDALFTPNDAPILHIDTSIWQQIDLQCTVHSGAKPPISFLF